jgi:hypothetical protein
MKDRTPKPEKGTPVDDTLLVGDENARLLLEQAVDEAELIVLEARQASGVPDLEFHQIRGARKKEPPVVKPRILKLMK